MTFIYILELENNKYYVGRTDNIDNRLKNHFNANGSHWTKLHKPINVKHVYDNCDVFDEDKYTIKFMAQHGINNVRGGSFSQITLNPEHVNLIEKMINNAFDNCFKCHFSNHFHVNCPFTKINNIKMIKLRKMILLKCKDIDTSTTNYINMQKLKDILIECDNIIFKNIDMIHLCKLIKKYNDVRITCDHDAIHYMSFVRNLIKILDDFLEL